MRKRPEVVLAGMVAAILILAVVAVVVATTRGSADYPTGSPERTLQSYLQAVIKGDSLAAFSYIADDSPCTQRDMDNAYIMDVGRVDIENVRTTSERSTIRVRLELGTDSVFGNAYTEEHAFNLVKESGEWKITDGAWPMYSCGEWVK